MKSQFKIIGTDNQSSTLFAPNCVVMKPEPSEPTSPPMQSIDPIHEISFKFIGPDANGVLFNFSCIKAGDVHPIVISFINYYSISLK